MRKNSRNARLQLCATLGGTYVTVNGTHGLRLGVPTNWSDSTAHGDDFDSATPGTQGFNMTLAAWYDTVESTLQAMSLNKISEFFRAYYDLDDPLNYYRGKMYLGQEEDNMDLNQTIDGSYTGRIADGDIQIIRNGAAL
jgi:hypothetical protein